MRYISVILALLYTIMSLGISSIPSTTVFAAPNSHANSPITQVSNLQSSQAYIALFQRYIDEKAPKLKNLQQQFAYNTAHLAVAMNDPRLLDAAINTGVDINTPAKDGNTPLHIAVGVQSLEFTQRLLQQGAKVNATTENARTPLHLASGYGNPQIVDLLLRHHANVNAMDDYGASPVTFARTENHEAIVAQLIKAGAKPRQHSVIFTDKLGNVSIIIDRQDPLIQHAIQAAQNSLPKFLHLAKRFPNTALVRFSTTLENNSSTSVWASIKHIDKLTLDVDIIPSSAAKHHNLPKHQTISKSLIEDWSVTLPNGKTRGAFGELAKYLAVKRELGALPSGFGAHAKNMVEYHAT